MRKYLIFALMLALSVGVSASCSGASPTWTCTPDSASLQGCLNGTLCSGFQRGNTINVSAGSATWSSALEITKGVKLLGAGQASVVITCSAAPVCAASSGDKTLVHINPDATAITNEETIQVDGFTFDANNQNTIFAVIYVDSQGLFNDAKPFKNLIVTNNTLKNTGSCNNNTGVYVKNGQVRGVVAANTFDRVEYPWRSFGLDDTRENANFPASFGSVDNLYFEDNTVQYSSSFTCTGDDSSGWIESGQGGRWVNRFNTWTMTNANGQSEFWDVHGNQNFYPGSINGQTSTMLSEFYDNTITSTDGTIFRWIDHRGGKLMMFDNTLAAGSTPDMEVNQYAIPPDARAGCYPYIENPNGSTYAGPDFTVSDTYFFNNKVNGTLSGATSDISINGCGVTENGQLSPYGTGVVYGWWNQQASFTGTVGMGRGTLASRPSTCTTGVGYWATDQGSWNTKLSPNTSGQFYKCTATNTWALYYTPETYPHPLRSPTIPTNAHAHYTIL